MPAVSPLTGPAALDESTAYTGVIQDFTGADLTIARTEKLAAGFVYRLLSITSSVVTSAAVAGRVYSVAYLDGDGVRFFASSQPGVQTASQGFLYVFSINAQPVFSAGGFGQNALIDVPLAAGTQIQLSLGGAQAGDVISGNVAFLLRQYPLAQAVLQAAATLQPVAAV